MTGYLLDTNVRTSERPPGKCQRHRVARCQRHQRTLALRRRNLRTQRGVALVERRDPDQAHLLHRWLEELINDYDDRILPITLGIAIRWGSLGIPNPLPVLAGLLAATALEHDLTVVTRNVTDIARSGVVIINPFD